MNASTMERRLRQHHHRHRSRLTRRVWQTIRVLAALAGVAAVAEFCATSYQARNCFEVVVDAEQQSAPRRPIESEDCRATIARRDVHLRVDATVVVVTILIVICAGVMLSHAHSST